MSDKNTIARPYARAIFEIAKRPAASSLGGVSREFGVNCVK